MQIRGLHKKIYNLYRYARKQECLDAYRQKYQDIVKSWDYWKSQGLKDKLIQEILGYSRATYYRAKKLMNGLLRGIIPPSKRPKHYNQPRWGEAEKQSVLEIRRENPTYGKEKIAVILQRDYELKLSVSTVGRIIKWCMNQGLIVRSASAIRTRKKRNFKQGHAKRWAYKKYEDVQMGERLQIDHMTVTKNGVGMKHFQAWDRKSKFMHAQIYSHAKSTSAKRFLDELIEKTPFPILSIQVDGGSEFMADFEEACQSYGIELIVLPPKRPEYNGGVERGNRTFREEFYESSALQADSLGAIRLELTQAVRKYNTYRPHFNLKGLTPMQYIDYSLLELAS